MLVVHLDFLVVAYLAEKKVYKTAAYWADKMAPFLVANLVY